MAPVGRTLIRALTWSLAPALGVATFVAGARGPTPALELGDVAYVALLAACWLVGVVITGRSNEQSAGWAFLGLATALSWSSFTDEYAPPGDLHPLPGYGVVATFSDTSWVWWFVALALVLLYTPPGPREGWLGRRLPAVTLAAGAVFQGLALIRSTELDPPYEGVVSPWAVPALKEPALIGSRIVVYLVGACVIAAAVLLVRAWRRTTGEAHRQLLWLVAGAMPVAPAVAAGYFLSTADQTTVATLLLILAMLSLVSGAAFSVLRYRLYDVERVVTESAAYAIASVSVVAIFVVVLVVISGSTPIDANSQGSTIAATLAGVVVARASYVWGRRAVGRRVNRTRFDAVETVRTGLSDSAADLDQLVAAALGGGARVVYPAAGGWVTAQGHEVTPADAYVELRRRDELTARVEYDPERNDAEVVEAVAAAAAPEIDNVALRAELARQVEVVTESRARLATAHLDERSRIERDLHDGAQQRLLSIALQLQAARVNGEPAALTREVDRAIVDLGETVQELRALAAGLQPAALTGGGLLAAVVDLAGRIPLRVDFDVVDRRFPARIEAAAWFVIAEAMANVVKHARTDEVCISVAASDQQLRIVVTDCGVGGADEHGHGLGGLADRVTALHGSLAVRGLEPHGTEVEAVLPCAS
jgi:signal transduction histidine kinase